METGHAPFGQSLRVPAALASRQKAVPHGLLPGILACVAIFFGILLELKYEAADHADSDTTLRRKPENNPFRL